MGEYYEEAATTADADTSIRFTDEQIDAMLAEKPSAAGKGVPVASAGPFSFEATPHLESKKVTVDVRFFGVPVGSVDLDPGAAEASLGPNLGFAKASISLMMSWEKKEVRFSAKACVRNWRFQWKCTKYSGKVFDW